MVAEFWIFLSTKNLRLYISREAKLYFHFSRVTMCFELPMQANALIRRTGFPEKLTFLQRSLLNERRSFIICWARTVPAYDVMRAWPQNE